MWKGRSKLVGRSERILFSQNERIILCYTIKNWRKLLALHKDANLLLLLEETLVLALLFQMLTNSWMPTPRDCSHCCRILHAQDDAHLLSMSFIMIVCASYLLDTHSCSPILLRKLELQPAFSKREGTEWGIRSNSILAENMTSLSCHNRNKIYRHHEERF